MVEDYFAQAIGFNTLKEMKANLIDKGDYFEFIKPVCGITMIQKKSPRKVMRWNAAMEYAKSLNLGGFNDWCLPLKEEFPMLGILMFFFAVGERQIKHIGLHLLKLMITTSPYQLTWISQRVTITSVKNEKGMYYVFALLQRKNNFMRRKKSD